MREEKPLSQPVLFPDPPRPVEAGLVRRTVRLTGELDFATQLEVRQACVTGDGSDVIVDLSKVTFMDCSAYGGLIAATLDLQNANGSLTLVNQSGQPARFLALVAAMFETSNAEVCRI
jgi:anti-anti-sigma factor